MMIGKSSNNEAIEIASLLWLLERTSISRISFCADICTTADDWLKVGLALSGNPITSLTLECLGHWQLDEGILLALALRNTLTSLSITNPKVHVFGADGNRLLILPPHASSSLLASHTSQGAALALDIKVLRLDYRGLYALSDDISIVPWATGNPDNRSRLALLDRALPKLDSLSISAHPQADANHQSRGTAFLIQQHGHKIRSLDLHNMSAIAAHLPPALFQTLPVLETLTVASFSPELLSLVPPSVHTLRLKICEQYTAYLLSDCLLTDRLKKVIPKLRLIIVDEWSEKLGQAAPETALAKMQETLAHLEAKTSVGAAGTEIDAAWLDLLSRACASKKVELRV